VHEWTPPRPDGGETDDWLRYLPPLPAAPLAPPRRRTGRVFTAFVALLVVAGVVSSAASLDSAVRMPTPQQQAGPRYAFIDTTPTGEPVRWNPCEPIHYVVNDALARYPEAVADTVEAAQRITDATGIAFVYDGETSEEAEPGRSPYQPGRYGDGWAPVLIAWTDPDDSAIQFRRGDDVALGVASPFPRSNGVLNVFVSGWIALNADYPGPGGFDTPSAVGLTIQHELGHVVGLGHTNVFGEVMQGGGGGALNWGPGDLAGLRELGTEAGCLTTPRIP
jgi:hypothetical protein